MPPQVRPRSVARRRLQKLLKHSEFHFWWSNLDRVPLGARVVLETAVDVVALCGDGCEYHVHPRDMEGGGIPARLAMNLRILPGNTEIQRHVDLLVDLGMLKVSGNVLRLGDC